MEVGPIFVDEVESNLIHGTNSVHVAPRCISMLRTLNARPNESLSETQLRKAIPRRRGQGASIRSIKSILNRAFETLQVPKSQLQIEGAAKTGYRLTLQGTKREAYAAKSSSFLSDTPSSPHFSLLMDGMIIDVAAELLMHSDSMQPTLRKCRESYQRGIEDFAFSVIYASSVTSSIDTIERSNDGGRYSRKEITDQLGSLWKFHALDRDLKQGRLLANTEHRELIKDDVQAAGQCIMNLAWPFRDWLYGDVARYLGSHESLFEEGLHPDELVFKAGATLSYYRDDELQGAFGEEATNLAVRYLREATRDALRPLSTSALREFATQSVIALVTIMRENDMSAARQNIWRMPHLLRSLVKQHVLFRNSEQMQFHLKSIVTQHALAAAFREVKSIDKRSLITVLVSMRNSSPFKDIREILEEHSLFLSRQSAENERKAALILNEIHRLANPSQGFSDTFKLAKGAALRELAKNRSDHYELQLYRVFPALRPGPV